MSKIMVVDDSLTIRKSLIDILTKAGHKVIAEAFNGLDAYAKYEKFLPELVTMDITMPVMDGIDSLKHILNKHPDAKIIMVSAVHQQEKVFEALKLGAKHYIVKPLSQQKIFVVIEEVLRMNKVSKLEKVTESK
jgi:YesN/AraC family two-component response regulator